MHQRTVGPVGALLLVSALSLSACDTQGGAVASSGTKTAVIGVMAPLTGEVSEFGLGIQHSVELAVSQANASNALPGWRLKVEARDDKGKPSVGKKVATAFAAEADVAGVVGNLNSGVSQSSQPVLAAANIVQVSPSNTNPTLTRGANFATDPVRPFASYFRTCTTDNYQGPFAARYLIGKAGIRKVATLHDKTTYGQGVVQAFTEEFTKLGGTVVATGTINPEKPNFTPFISKLRSTRPSVVYYGGQYPQAGKLAALMSSASLKIKLMAADAVYNPKYITLAGASASGDLATNVGAPTSHLAAGQKFLADYDAAGYKEPSAAYGGYSFDAANAIINALKESLKDAKDVVSARKATIEALGNTSFNGVTGKVDFDQYGDSVTHMLTIYQVTGAKWVPISTEFVM
ncbi:MAG: branched-chain amino acid transport system substrate-binding protein [Actinomycetota bacterium]|nr:branched-chain amino acid transport system substrate-binding protein [Actinomycetota bacterium]